MKFIENVGQAPRMASMWGVAGLLVTSAIQADWVPLIEPFVPPEYWPMVSGGFALAIGILRLIAQPGLKANANKEAP